MGSVWDNVCLAAALVAMTTACTPTKSDAVASTGAADTTNNAGQGLVISQVYGGGATTATWNRGYVELFNKTSTAIPLKGLSLHYAGPISEFGLAASLPDAAIVAPGGYYLIGFLASQSGLDVKPDTNGLPVNVLPVNGKLALVRAVDDSAGDGSAANQKMGCGSADAGTCVGNARVLDVVGYGITTDHEGPQTASPPSQTTAIFRKNAGCTDTGDNNADFEVAAPAPRTAATARHVCPESGQ